MCEFLVRFEGWLVMCCVSGCGLCFFVKVWFSGVDWIMCLFVNCLCDGVMMFRFGGGLCLWVKLGVFVVNWFLFLLVGLLFLVDCCCNFCLIICFWCFLMFMLCCSCFFMIGFWVMKLGDR